VGLERLEDEVVVGGVGDGGGSDGHDRQGGEVAVVTEGRDRLADDAGDLDA
jgi:hypothetical protein